MVSCYYQVLRAVYMQKKEKNKLPMESELHHHIVYKDGDEEWQNLLQRSIESPAWVVEAFAEDRFDF